MKILLVFGLVWQLSQCAKEYPEYLQKYRCHKSDLDYSGCMLNKFRSVLPYYVKGIPELGIPALDPYTKDSIDLKDIEVGITQFQGKISNILATGIKNTIFHSVKMDPIKKSSEFSFTIPWIDVNLDFDLNGQIYSAPMTFKGHFHGNFSNIQFLCKSNVQTYTKEGLEYFKLDKLTPKLAVSDGKIDISVEDKALQPTVDTLVMIFNENPREALDALIPIFLKGSLPMMRKAVNNLFATLPTSEWLPE